MIYRIVNAVREELKEWACAQSEREPTGVTVETQPRRTARPIR